MLSDGSTKYLWSPDGSLLAQDALAGSTTPGVAGEAITDTMGSVYSLVTQENGAFADLAQYSYSAFGERTLTSGTNVSAMGFTSEQHDDSGLIYLRFRYMDPQIGQFISVDPLVSSTLDPYGYASGNPLQMTDPLGLWSWEDTDGLMDNIGTIAGYTALAATAIVLIAATGGVALPLIAFAATASGTVGAITGLYAAGRECRGGFDSACGWEAGGVALDFIPMVRPIRKLDGIANEFRPQGLSPLDDAAWSTKNTAAKAGIIGIEGVGVGYGHLSDYCK